MDVIAPEATRMASSDDTSPTRKRGRVSVASRAAFTLPRLRVGLVLVVSVLGATALTGCVQRRMTIRSNPPGALVYVDNYEIGRTPVSTDFIYYGTRRIRLEADGYQTYTAEQNFWPPWYEFPGLDFVTENLWPWEIRDERVVDFTLTPQIITPTDALLARANDLRRGSRHEGVAAVVQPGVPAVTTPLIPPAPAPSFPAPPQPAPLPGRQYETLPPGGQALPSPPPKTGWMDRLMWWR